MKKEIRVQAASGSYAVHIGVELREAGAYARQLDFRGKAFIVTDSNVQPLYGEALAESLRKAGFDTGSVILPAGEEHKRLESIQRIYDELHRHGMTRSDLVFALGGGVVGDMAGFAAGTFLRGIPFVQIPTTLLAQIDSSVGGKTGVDLEYGKNLVGMFNQPVMVLIDPSLLSTLPPETMADGMAEAIKYGLIRDASLFERLASRPGTIGIEELIHICVEIKNRVVSKDERDAGERMILNFGHTVGHAIEKCGDYTKYTHGQAVAAGMVLESLIGEYLGVTPKGTAARVRDAVLAHGLPASTSEDPAALYEALLSDKKKSGSTISLVLLERIGSAVIRPTPVEEIRALLARSAENPWTAVRDAGIAKQY